VVVFGGICKIWLSYSFCFLFLVMLIYVRDGGGWSIMRIGSTTGLRGNVSVLDFAQVKAISKLSLPVLREIQSSTPNQTMDILSLNSK